MVSKIVKGQKNCPFTKVLFSKESVMKLATGPLAKLTCDADPST